MNTKHKTPILLIEDNLGDVELMKFYLEEAGLKYELYHAATLFDGLDILQRQPVDLVLIDLNLPDSTGFKTVTSYLERVSKTPVIFMTGNHNEILGNQAVKAGAQDFLVKGQFDSKLLGRVIRYSLQRAKVQMKLEETASELEVNKKRFLEAQEMAHFGTWEMDLVSNEMKWTEEVFRIFGFQPGNITPTLSTYLDFVHMEDKDDVESFFEKAGKDGQLHQLEHRILVDGTNIRYVTVYAKIQIEESVGKILLVGGIQDITERKLSERLLLEKNISSKTAKVQEEALSELSFQIKTPLSSVVNLLFLMENTHVSPQQEAYLKDLKISVDDLSIAVNNLMNFTVMLSDTVRVEEEEFNIRDFMQGTRQALQIKADAAKLKLEFRTDEKLPEKLISDPKKLTQVLYNLIDNAIRFTKEGGKITVSVSMEEIQGNKANLVLVIKDSGIGMSKRKIYELTNIEKFIEKTTEEDEAKQPLGIVIVDKLVKTLGGNYYINSQLGEGTTFQVEIPIMMARKARFIAGDAPDSPLKILLVEDHFLNQMATKKVLQSWSGLVSVDIAENGLIAIQKFNENNYDIILMDIQMPVMNGLDAAEKIRESSDVPIIALTANSTKPEQDKCFEIGMNDYLAKPFKPQELYSKIMNILSMVMN